MKRTPSARDTATLADRESFAALMAELHEGCEQAAWKLVELYTPHVIRVVRSSLPRSIRSKVDSIDLANTLFGSILVNRHRLTDVSESDQFLALLTKAARNRVIDEHRKFTRCAARSLGREEGVYEERELTRSGGGVAGDGRLGGREQTPSQIVSARERWEQVLATLDRRQRAIIALKIGGSTYAQIAEQVPDVSERTARRIVSMVADKLQE